MIYHCVYLQAINILKNVGFVMLTTKMLITEIQIDYDDMMPVYGSSHPFNYQCFLNKVFLALLVFRDRKAILQ